MYGRIVAFLSLFAFTSPAVAFDAQPAQTKIVWTASTVSLEVRKADGTIKSFTGIPWSLNMTALDAMKMVDDLKFTAEWSKSLGQWFVTSIDGVANQGAGKPYWGFCVDGYPAGVGAGSYVLGSKASVVWVYDSAYPTKCN
jgi:hypothetical protein